MGIKILLSPNSFQTRDPKTRWEAALWLRPKPYRVWAKRQLHVGQKKARPTWRRNDLKRCRMTCMWRNVSRHSLDKNVQDWLVLIWMIDLLIWSLKPVWTDHERCPRLPNVSHSCRPESVSPADQFSQHVESLKAETDIAEGLFTCFLSSENLQLLGHKNYTLRVLKAWLPDWDCWFDNL